MSDTPPDSNRVTETVTCSNCGKEQTFDRPPTEEHHAAKHPTALKWECADEGEGEPGCGATNVLRLPEPQDRAIADPLPEGVELIKAHENGEGTQEAR